MVLPSKRGNDLTLVTCNILKLALNNCIIDREREVELFMANIKVLDRLKPCEDITRELFKHEQALYILSDGQARTYLTRSRIQTGLGLVLPGFWGQIPRNRRCSK